MTKEVYVCEACKMIYAKKELAKKCEDFCRKYRSCNTEITKHSIGEIK